MFIRLTLTACLLAPTLATASIQAAQRTWESSPSAWRKLVIELVEGGKPFSAVPFMKEFLIQNRAALDTELEQTFERLITHTGVRPFETLPDAVLDQSRSPVIRYVLAKKHFRAGRWAQAQAELARVNANHPVYPFAVHLRAATHAMEGKTAEAERDFRDCVSFSRSRYNGESDPVKLRQLLFNRDSCVAGLARAAYGKGEYARADLLFLDVPKSSYIWPEILHEEAWTSYQLKNYNRTLGKLVSYKAPVFDFVFNPEIDVLRALAYMRMCLYDDVNKTVEDFYTQWQDPAKNMRGFIMQHGRDYDYYYRLLTTFEKERQASDFLMQAVLLSTVKDPAWQEMRQALIDAVTEHNSLKGSVRGAFGTALARNVRSVVDDYQNLMGSYAVGQFRAKYGALAKAFEDMSFIKLEVLSRKKQALYEDAPTGGKRGDIRYIQRNEKQYFWNFNGEFWADELGDYVFALRSEC